MEYIKSYKIFESVEITHADIVLEASDILIECEDIGLTVEFLNPDHYGLSFPNSFVVGIHKNSFKKGSKCFSDISPNIHHLISYMKSIGYEKYSYFNMPGRNKAKPNTLPSDSESIDSVLMIFKKLGYKFSESLNYKNGIFFSQMKDDIVDIFSDLTDMEGIDLEVSSESKEDGKFDAIVKVHVNKSLGVLCIGDYKLENYKCIDIEETILHLERYMSEYGYDVKLYFHSDWLPFNFIKSYERGANWKYSLTIKCHENLELKD